MSLATNILSMCAAFILLAISVVVHEIGLISEGTLAFIAALWFVSFVGNAMFLATYTSGGRS
jgi:hypothetical protein